MEGDWVEWRNHILNELRRLSDEQHVLNGRIQKLLEFRTETKTSTKVTATLISVLFGLISMGVSIYVSVVSLH